MELIFVIDKLFYKIFDKIIFYHFSKITPNLVFLHSNFGKLSQKSTVGSTSTILFKSFIRLIQNFFIKKKKKKKHHALPILARRMYNECTSCKQNTNFLQNLDIDHKDKIERRCCQSGKGCCNIGNKLPTKQETQDFFLIFIHFFSNIFFLSDQ